jgi:hypothetical protein
LWKAEGPEALVQMRKEDNTRLCQMMAGLIPRDLVLSVEDNTSPFAELSPEEKRRLAGMLMDQLAAEKARVIEASSVPACPSGQNRSTA